MPGLGGSLVKARSLPIRESDQAVDGFESVVATVAFVDLAGFSAITDVYGDASYLSGLPHLS